MPSPQGPLLPRRRLGAELRRLRDTRTLDEVAAETLISTSKLSRLENGQGVPQPRDIRDLIAFYKADRAVADRIRRWAADGRRQAWWKDYSDVLSDSVDIFLDYESGASIIRTYSPMVLPGLLQTRAYATRLIKLLRPQRTAQEVDKLVEVRLRRQQILLTDAPDATSLFTVIDEAAVLRALHHGSENDGREQLEYLRSVSTRKNVSLRILPMNAGLHPGVLSTFTVIQFADDIDRDVVQLEGRSADNYLEEQSGVLDHIRLYDAVANHALDYSESRDFLTRLLEAPLTTQEKT